MKIALNCSFFVPKGGGVKEYIFNLTNKISEIDQKNQYILYVSLDGYEYAKEKLPNSMTIKTTPFNSNEKIKRSILERFYWRKEEKIEKFDIFHSPFFHSPTFKRAKVILTIHDLRFCRYPNTYTFLRYYFLNSIVKRSINSASHIISISNFTKQEILNIYKIKEEKITVIHEAINKEIFNKRIIADYKSYITEDIRKSKFILSVGHLEPRKNYERLISVFKNLFKDGLYKDLKLVIVGKKGHDYKRTLEMIKDSSNIIYLDFVDHSLLLWLYANTTLFVFPSIYEGFGFPPLEAACFGTVSAVSNLSSIPEICGNSVFYFNPFNNEDMKISIEKALYDLPEIENRRSLLDQNLARFSWEKNAMETICLYNKIFD